MNYGVAFVLWSQIFSDVIDNLVLSVIDGGDDCILKVILYCKQLLKDYLLLDNKYSELFYTHWPHYLLFL